VSEALTVAGADGVQVTFPALSFAAEPMEVLVRDTLLCLRQHAAGSAQVAVDPAGDVQNLN
jgi:hypothetical protein